MIHKALHGAGVFVVERPGLGSFLRQVAAMGELSVFTAGLPEYAMPIVRAIDPTGEFFGDRVVCRGGTCAAPEYPCVKDLSRLGRDLAQTCIIDDTPLAFLWQPANGVPVLGFRGDPDDNLLLEAVLPLLQLAAAESDVRPFLDARFGMSTWFTTHGYTTHAPATSKPGKAEGMGVPALPAAAPQASIDAVAANVARRSGVPRGGPLLLCDFDQTLVDFDVTERITEHLAIELKPFLQNFEAPADFVPVMNSVLREMEMRGVAIGALLDALRALGRGFCPELAAALRATAARGVANRVLSNCNTLFIGCVVEVRLQLCMQICLRMRIVKQGACHVQVATSAMAVYLSRSIAFCDCCVRIEDTLNMCRALNCKAQCTMSLRITPLSAQPHTTQPPLLLTVHRMKLRLLLHLLGRHRGLSTWRLCKTLLLHTTARCAHPPCARACMLMRCISTTHALCFVAMAPTMCALCCACTRQTRH